MGSRIIFHAGLGLPASVWITEINEYMAAKILQKIVNILSCVIWGRYYFDTFIDKAKKGEIFKGNKILNKNSGKIGFDTFRLKLVESNWTLIPFLHDFDEVLG